MGLMTAMGRDDIGCAPPGTRMENPYMPYAWTYTCGSCGDTIPAGHYHECSRTETSTEPERTVESAIDRAFEKRDW